MSTKRQASAAGREAATSTGDANAIAGAGPCWASLPNELLQAILAPTSPQTVKAARLVCRGWRAAQPHLRPSIPLLSYRTRPGLSTLRAPGAAGPSALLPFLPSSSAAPLGATETAVSHLQWLSCSLSGQLELRGTVVLTLVNNGSADAAHLGRPTSAPGGASVGPAPAPAPAPWPLGTGDAGSAAGRRRGKLPRVSSMPKSVAAAAAADEAAAAAAAAAAADVMVSAAGPPGPGSASAGPVRAAASDGVNAPDGTIRSSPLAAALRQLAATGVQSLRIQHASGGPAAGLLPPHACDGGCAQTGACGGGGGGWGASRRPNDSGDARPFHAVTYPLAAAGTTLPPPACSAAAAAAAAGCRHCCDCASAPPPPQTLRRVPGLGAVSSLRSLRSLELSGVALGPSLLSRLSELPALTALCFDLPLPANAAALQLSSLTGLRSLHFTLRWPVPLSPRASRRSPAGTGAAATASPATAAAAGVPGQPPGSSNGTSSHVGTGSAAEGSDVDMSYFSDHDKLRRSDHDQPCRSDSESGSDSDGPGRGGGGFERHSRHHTGDSALTMAAVLPAVTALAAAPALEDVRLRVCSSHMARSLLSPPGLLAATKEACPRLRRFGFLVQSEWQSVPKTLYNWIAADLADHALGPLHEDAAGADRGLLIWQALDWEAADAPPAPAAAAAAAGCGCGGGGGLASAGSGGTPLARTPGGGAVRTDPTAAAAAAAGPSEAEQALAARVAAAAAARPGLSTCAGARVGVSLRTSGSSWLGACLDAAAGLDAVASGLPGARLESLALEDGAGAQGDVGELSLRALEALGALRQLSLRGLRRGLLARRPRTPAEAPGDDWEAAGPDYSGDFAAQLLQLPSLRGISLAAPCPEWLDAILPRAGPRPGPGPSPRRPCAPARTAPPSPAPSHGAAGSGPGPSAGDAGSGSGPGSGSGSGAGAEPGRGGGAAPQPTSLAEAALAAGRPELVHLNLRVSGLAAAAGGPRPCSLNLLSHLRAARARAAAAADPGSETELGGSGGSGSASEVEVEVDEEAEAEEEAAAGDSGAEAGGGEEQKGGAVGGATAGAGGREERRATASPHGRRRGRGRGQGGRAVPGPGPDHPRPNTVYSCRGGGGGGSGGGGGGSNRRQHVGARGRWGRGG